MPIIDAKPEPYVLNAGGGKWFWSSSHILVNSDPYLTCMVDLSMWINTIWTGYY